MNGKLSQNLITGRGVDLKLCESKRLFDDPGTCAAERKVESMTHCLKARKILNLAKQQSRKVWQSRQSSKLGT